MKQNSNRLLCVIIAVLFTAVFCVKNAYSQSKNKMNDAEKVVYQPINDLFEGMRKSDTTLMRSAFHSTMRLMSCSVDKQKKPILAEGNVNDFIKSIAAPHSEMYDERITDFEIKIDGNLASVWTKYEFYVGNKFSHCGVNAFQLFQTESGWKIIQITDTRRRENCR